MDWRLSTSRLAVFLVSTLAATFTVAACASSGAPSSGAPSASIAPASAAATAQLTSPAPSPSPASTATEPTPSSGSGPVIHVNVYVPLAADSAPGSTCDATALAATGPKAATIPGSPMRFLVIADPDGGTLGAIGERPVPRTGTVADPISDDPRFPAACRFSFDVPTTTSDTDRYFFSLGEIYFPIPIILRDDLEAAGWVANIGVNPQ